MEIVTIQLTAQDAEKFKLFQKFYVLFDMLEKMNLFTIKFGKATINIAHGEIQNVVREEVAWKRI